MRKILQHLMILSAVLFSSCLQAQVISDSLVRNLNCTTLTKQTVLLSLQPDAFDKSRHLPVLNWGDSNGLANCWSLSHAQRLTFYLGRFGEAAPTESSAAKIYLQRILGLYKGDTPTSESVFPILNLQALYMQLSLGEYNGDFEQMTFAKTISDYQKWRFYRLSNMGMILGNRDRSTKTNTQTYQKILADLAKGRLPIVILRPALTDQHSVLVKRYLPPEENSYEVKFEVYDSNDPRHDNILVFDRLTSEFTAPAIVARLGIGTSSPPVGVFLVDDDDMDEIQTALYQHYQNQCETAGRSHAP